MPIQREGKAFWRMRKVIRDNPVRFIIAVIFSIMFTGAFLAWLSGNVVQIQVICK